VLIAKLASVVASVLISVTAVPVTTYAHFMTGDVKP
jgi:hypothetical protein